MKRPLSAKDGCLDFQGQSAPPAFITPTMVETVNRRESAMYFSQVSLPFNPHLFPGAAEYKASQTR